VYSSRSLAMHVMAEDQLGLTPASGVINTVTGVFGCQTSESGIFRTQLADGIMGCLPPSTTVFVACHEKRAQA
jgi:hypothetical protein